MKKCKGCVYWNDMQNFVHGKAVYWPSNEPHPCMGCKRYPKIREIQFDNYRKLMEAK